MQNQSTAERHCAYCGTLLVRRSSETVSNFEARITCSHRCSGRLSWSRPERHVSKPRAAILPRLCAICGKEFKPSHQEGQCCSQACASQLTVKTRRSMNPEWGEIVELTCSHCAKPFTAYSSMLVGANGSPKQYCSKECASLGRRSPERITACARCGKEIRTRNSVDRTYCSHSCGSKARLGFIRSETNKFEASVVEALRSLGHEIAPQYRIGRFTVDVLIPSLSIALECHGDYFHCNPAIYPNGPIDQIQRRNIDRDARRIPVIEEKGFRVVVVWQADVMAHGAIESLARVGIGRV